MGFIPREKSWTSEEDDDIAEIPRVATRPSSRRDRMKGLGIKGVNVTTTPIPDTNSLQTPLRRRVSARRSFVSLITRSSEPGTGKTGSARVSSSRSDQFIVSELSRVSPPLWRHSNSSSPSFMSDSSSDGEEEDITTYHANLARFKSERAERAVELGLENYDLPSRTESSRLELLQAREEQARKSSGLGMGRGLRAYWGGGGNAEGKTSKNSAKGSPTKSIASENSNVIASETIRVDKETLQEWWDHLG